MIKPCLFFRNFTKLVSLFSIGLSSFPGLACDSGACPVHQPIVQKRTVKVAHANYSIALRALPILEVEWIPVRITSYCWQEPDHAAFGFHNCMGGDLTKQIEGFPQCAADLNCYPLGTLLFIKTEHITEIRIVTDCGKAVRGPFHIDLHFNSLAEMETRGTRSGFILVVRWGWTGFRKASR